MKYITELENKKAGIGLFPALFISFLLFLIVGVVNNCAPFSSYFAFWQGLPRRTRGHVYNPRHTKSTKSQWPVKNPRKPICLSASFRIDISSFWVHKSSAASTCKKDTGQQDNHSPCHRKPLSAPINKGPNNRAGNFPVNPTETVAPSCDNLWLTGKLGRWPLRQRFAFS